MRYNISIHSVFCSADFGASGEQVEVVETKEFIGDQAFCTATTYLHKVIETAICVYYVSVK